MAALDPNLADPGAHKAIPTVETLPTSQQSLRKSSTNRLKAASNAERVARMWGDELVAGGETEGEIFSENQSPFTISVLEVRAQGAVAGVVGIAGGVVSGVFNPEDSGVDAPDRRPRHEKRYHDT